MLVINTINEFLALPLAAQQEIQRSVKGRERLESYLIGLNKPPKIEPHWVKCNNCNDGKCLKCSPQHPGWRWYEQKLRDNSDIHPSQIDKCLKYLVMCCSGYAESHEETISPQLRMLFDLGHAWHDTMQRYGKQGAWGEPDAFHPEFPIDPDAVTFDGQPALPIAAHFWIKGSADALLDRYVFSTPTMGDVCMRIIHEYKTMNSNQYGSLKSPKPQHKRQATIYSAVFDVPMVIYFYTNKDNNQMADFPVPFDNSMWAEITNKMHKVQHYVNNEIAVPWEETSAVKAPSECQQCPLKRACQPPLTRRM
jgi:CRISPR/Cas system-associated exonuclease Cas4 (RecB family)